MGGNSSLTYKMIEPDTKVYYSSAKFREAQIYQLIHNDPLIDFPTSSCFFVTESFNSSLLYSKVIQQPRVFLQHSENRQGTRSHDVTHTYLVKSRQTTVQLNDPKTLHYILFEDGSSPFHISKATEHLMTIDIFSTRGTKGWPSMKVYEDKHKVRIDPGSGFALILGATNYMNYELHGDDISRVSFYELDYTIIKLLKEYLIKVNPDIQGWSQPAGKFFHQEYMFFNPGNSLVPDYEDPASWFQRVTVTTSYPKTKRSFLWLLKVGEQRLNSLKTTFTKDLTYLKHQARQLSEGNAVTSSGLDDMLEANLELQQEIIQKEERLFKENTLTFLVPYLSDLYKLRSKYNKLQEIFFIDNKVECHLEENCTEPFGFERCQQNLKSLAKQMRLYETKPNHHHKSSSVADHSIWVARTIHKWFQYEKHPWTDHIWQEFQNITLLAAFLHDIGKVGDLDFHSLQTLGVKDDHPFKGYEYILARLLFKVVDTDQKVTHHKLLDYIGCTFNKVDVVVLALVIAMHHYFGQLIMTIEKVPISKLQTTIAVTFPFGLDKAHYKVGFEPHSVILDTLDKVNFKQVMFLHQLLRYLKEVDHEEAFATKPNLVQLIHIIFAVSAADTYGAFPVNLPQRQATDTSVLEPEFLYETTSEPEVSVVINRPFYKYLYHTIGLQQKFTFLVFISKVVNLQVFLSAWDNFNRFIEYLVTGQKMLPYPYNYLSQDSRETFLDDLFNLLELGNVDEQELPNKTLDYVLRLELTGDLNDIVPLDDTVDIADILLGLDEEAQETQPPTKVPLQPNIFRFDKLTLEFKGEVLRTLKYEDVHFTLEKYITGSLSLFPDIKVDKVHEPTLTTVTLRYVGDQAFSIRQVRYDKVNHLSDLLIVLLAFTRAPISFEDYVPEEGPLRDLLQRFEFDLSQVPPVRQLRPTIGTLTQETISSTLCIHYYSLELLHELSRTKTGQYGFFEVDHHQGSLVTLNTSKLNLQPEEFVVQKTFPLKVAGTLTADDLCRVILSYIQGPDSTLNLFHVTEEGLWSLSLTVGFQGTLIMIRDLADHSTLNKILSQVKLWFNNFVQRLTQRSPTFIFLDVINNLTGRDLNLSSLQIDTLFKVTSVPWNVITADEKVYVPLEYKIDLEHNLGPLFCPTFKPNLLISLLFQTP